MSDDLASLVAEIKKLVEKLDAPKKRDWSEKIATITPFLSTVVLAAISLWVTWSSQKAAAQHDKQFHDAQIEVAKQNAQHDKDFHYAQVRVAELEAISKLIPALSSKDTTQRKRAEELLQAVQQSRQPTFTEPKPAGPANEANSPIGANEPNKSLLDTYAAIVQNDEASVPLRIDAATNIAKAASAPGISTDEQRRAEEVLGKVAKSSTTPPAVRIAAESAIAGIKRVYKSQIADLIKNEAASRAVDEIILHHTSSPDRHGYKGLETIKSFANVWTHLGYKGVPVHYLVAPDGTIWVGLPLNQAGTHTAGKNATTVGVMLILDGDKELPSDQQREALVALLRALFLKFNLRATENFAPGHGFHRDHFRMKTCPGTLMTKELVLSWVSETNALHN